MPLAVSRVHNRRASVVLHGYFPLTTSPALFDVAFELSQPLVSNTSDHIRLEMALATKSQSQKIFEKLKTKPANKVRVKRQDMCISC